MKRHDPSTKDKLENWLGKHNRKLELLRTITSFIGTTLTLLVFLRVFSII
jgi:hypothetical protein